MWDSILIFENSSPGLPLCNFWESMGICRVLRTPQALDLVRPECIHVCMYVCMYVFMHACLHVCMYVCMFACMYVCIANVYKH